MTQPFRLLTRSATLALLASLMLGTATLASAAKIAMVDMDRVVKESREGKQTIAALEQEQQKRQTELKTDEEALKKMAGEMQNMMLSEDARQNKGRQAQAAEGKLREKVQKYQGELEEKSRGMMEKLLVRVRAGVDKVATRDKYDLILNKAITKQFVLYDNFGMVDITDLVIKQVDADGAK